ALEATHVLVIGTQGEEWDAEGTAQFGEVVDFAVEHDPADSGGGRGPGHLGERSSDGLEDNAIGTLVRGSLHDFEKLLALEAGIVLRVENLEVDIETARGFECGVCLLNLVVVVTGGE